MVRRGATVLNHQHHAKDTTGCKWDADNGSTASKIQPDYTKLPFCCMHAFIQPIANSEPDTK